MLEQAGVALLMRVGDLVENQAHQALDAHNLAEFRNLSADAERDLTVRYTALCEHYGMTPTRNNWGVAQRIRLGRVLPRPPRAPDRGRAAAYGSWDFADLAAYRAFVDAIVARHNARRLERLDVERAALGPLLPRRADEHEQHLVTVTRSGGFVFGEMLLHRAVPARRPPTKTDVGSVLGPGSFYQRSMAVGLISSARAIVEMRWRSSSATARRRSGSGVGPEPLGRVQRQREKASTSSSGRGAGRRGVDKALREGGGTPMEEQSIRSSRRICACWPEAHCESGSVRQSDPDHPWPSLLGGRTCTGSNSVTAGPRTANCVMAEPVVSSGRRIG